MVLDLILHYGFIAVKLLVILVEISQIVVILVEMSILICYLSAGTGKPDTRGYPSGAGAGKVFRPRAASRAGKDRQRGYARGRVNALPALTRPAAIPAYTHLQETGPFTLVSPSKEV